MRNVFVFIGLAVLLLSFPVKGRAAGCYITPTNDYICDEAAPDNEGETVQDDTRNNIPGSDDVFQTNDIRSQTSWLPGVLVNLGMNLEGSGSGDIDIDNDDHSGSGTAQWSGAECEEGQDAYETFKAHLLSREGRRNCSYYDGTGANCPYTGPGPGGGGNCSSTGCLTIGVGHLVRSGETQYTPCGTCITDAQVDALLEEDASRFWQHVTSHLQEACLEDEGCFAVALGSVLYQGGTNFLRGTFSRRWNQIVAGEYGAAASGLESSRWYQQSPTRVRDFQQALNALQARKDAGENIGCS
jgi:GH24 family phage-related lysozyme (muramidase)